MKKLLLFCLSLFLIHPDLWAQEVTQVQKSVITKRTATWCPYCGTWGWELFEGLIEDNSEKAVLIAAHFGGSQLETTTSAEYLANLGGAGQPRFFLNNDLQSASASTIADTRASIKQQVDANYLLQPIANSGSYSSFDGNMLNIQTRTVFFQQAEGEFYLGVYLIEDDVLNSQAGQSGEVMHHYVMRDAATSTTFGDLLGSGTIAAGSEFTANYSVDVSDYVPANLDVVTIIWKKEGAFYQFVNAWSEDAGNAPTTGLQEVPQNTPEILLQKSAQGYEIQLHNEQAFAKTRLSLVNSSGQELQRLYEGSLPAGTHPFTLERQARPAGIYYLHLQTEQGQKTLPLSFE